MEKNKYASNIPKEFCLLLCALKMRSMRAVTVIYCRGIYTLAVSLVN